MDLLFSLARDLVCGINHAFLTGFLDGLGAASATAVLNPAPGHCCVELRAAGTDRERSAGGPERSAGAGEGETAVVHITYPQAAAFISGRGSFPMAEITIRQRARSGPAARLAGKIVDEGE